MILASPSALGRTDELLQIQEDILGAVPRVIRAMHQHKPLSHNMTNLASKSASSIRVVLC